MNLLRLSVGSALPRGLRAVLLLLLAGALLLMHAGVGQAASCPGSSSMVGSPAMTSTSIPSDAPTGSPPSTGSIPSAGSTLHPTSASSGQEPSAPDMAAMTDMCVSTPALSCLDLGTALPTAWLLPTYVVGLAPSTQACWAGTSRPPRAPDPVTELGVSRT